MMTNAIEMLIVGEWAEAVVLALLGAGIRGVLLLAVVLAGAMALHRASAATRHALLAAGFLTMLALPFGRLLPWQLPLLPAGVGSTVRPQVSTPAEDLSSLRSAIVSSSIGADLQAQAADAVTEFRRGGAGVDLATQPATGSTEATGLAAAPRASFGEIFVRAAIGLWLLGILFFGGRILVSHWLASRLVGRASAVTDPAWMALLWESSD